MSLAYRIALYSIDVTWRYYRLDRLHASLPAAAGSAAFCCMA